MSMIIVAVFSLFILFMLYRYVPAAHMKKMDLSETAMEKGDMVAVDTRDYQTSSQDAYEKSYCLPLAYLERHHRDLPTDRPVVLICSDEVEKNLAARLLRRKGYKVIGYMVPPQNAECTAMPCMIEK